MKHIILFEEFVNESTVLSSQKFKKQIIDTVAKKCPWAEITSEKYEEKRPNSALGDSGSITFDNAVTIHWQEGPENVTNSMIGVRSDGRFQKQNLDPNRKTFGEEVYKTTGWKNQDRAIATLIKTLKSNSSNSPINA
jgi:hypothetical protein